MPKGKHKGGRRCFTNFAEEEQLRQKEEKQKAWRKARGEKEDEEEKGSSSEVEEEEEESSDSSEEEEDDTFKKPKNKGVSDLIEIENPNRVSQKDKKVSSITTTADIGKPQLSRREREEIEKQRAHAHYQKMHSQGKTEQARADLERLALIRKQREEAQQKKEDDKKVKEAAAMAKKDQVAKALNKKSKS